MCRNAEESVDDLLIHCRIEKYDIFSFPPLAFVLPFSIQDL